MPPLMQGMSAPTGMDANAAGGQPTGPDQVRGQLEAAMGKIRDLGQQVEDLGTSLPALAPEVQQIRQILKRMVTKAAQQAPQQTASSQGLPG